LTTLAESGMSTGNLTRLQVILFGPLGKSKTVSAHAMPNTRTIDFDDGIQSVEWAIKEGVIKKELHEIVYETILPSDAKEQSTTMLDRATDKIDEWLDDEKVPTDEWSDYCMAKPGITVPYPQRWDTLIIDSASGLTEASIILGLKENKRVGQSKSWDAWKKGHHVRPMRIQDWGSAGYLQAKFIEDNRLIEKNLVVICHQYDNTDDTGNTISIDPSLIGQNRQGVPKSFDEVWYAFTQGTRSKPEFRIQTTPGANKNCRSRLGCLDPVEILDFYAIRKKVAEFYQVDEEILWTSQYPYVEETVDV